MTEAEMPLIADLVVKVIENVTGDKGEIDERVAKEVSSQVKELTDRFPLYTDLVSRSELDV